jgi:hypothetical protein
MVFLRRAIVVGLARLAIRDEKHPQDCLRNCIPGGTIASGGKVPLIDFRTGGDSYRRRKVHATRLRSSGLACLMAALVAFPACGNERNAAGGGVADAGSFTSGKRTLAVEIDARGSANPWTAYGYTVWSHLAP